MTTLIEPLGMSAGSWAFLRKPNEYVRESAKTKPHAEDCAAGRQLVPATTSRQFATAREILARLCGTNGKVPQYGVLLADDVGLGKTTVAALVAWCFAGTGKHTVRILAPNKVMQRRWRDELKFHAPLLKARAPTVNADASRIRVGRVTALKAGRIQVGTHHLALANGSLACDLLIVDEAHRAKGEDSKFAGRLQKHLKNVKRVLILTATPFSIDLKEFERLLCFVRGAHATRPVKAFSRRLAQFYGSGARDNPAHAEKALLQAAEGATSALSPILIRHSVDLLPKEVRRLGSVAEWKIDVPHASDSELEVLLRMDRLLRLQQHLDGTPKVSNDPRFHVGWSHLDHLLATLPKGDAVVNAQRMTIRKLRRKLKVHSKMIAVGAAIRDTVSAGERVILFCHHHATAGELARYLDSILPTKPSGPGLAVWKHAWSKVLEHEDDEVRKRLVAWLSSSHVCSQVRSRLPAVTHADPPAMAKMIDAAFREKGKLSELFCLYREMRKSGSSSAVLASSVLPGTRRVVCVGPEDVDPARPGLFIGKQQPDTVLAMLNSPFGPDVAVLTDALSEGIDLHRHCRRLVHYELDPSPVRTIQRNGRLRRVGSLASRSNDHTLWIAYPTFPGTRDERLVAIMRKRLEAFGLLLGGAPTITNADLQGTDEQWRADTIKKVQKQLEKSSKALAVKQ